MQENVLEAKATLIYLMDAVRGRLTITRNDVTFLADESYVSSYQADPFHVNDEKGHVSLTCDDSLGDFHFRLSELRAIHFRRYQLRPTALELFLVGTAWVWSGTLGRDARAHVL